jgi:hypothetical protein
MKHLYKQWFLALPIEGKRRISGWDIDPSSQEDMDLAFNDWCGLSVYEMQSIYEYYHDVYFEDTKDISIWLDDYDYYLDKYAS